MSNKLENNRLVKIKQNIIMNNKFTKIRIKFSNKLNKKMNK